MALKSVSSILTIRLFQKMSSFVKLLSNIKNAIMVKKTSISFKYLNKKAIKLLNVLYTKGFIQGFHLCKNTKKVSVFLRYFHNMPVINGFYIYIKSRQIRSITLKELYLFKKNLSHLFILTKRGVKTGQDCLILKQGGFPLFYLY